MGGDGELRDRREIEDRSGFRRRGDGFGGMLDRVGVDRRQLVDARIEIGDVEKSGFR